MPNPHNDLIASAIETVVALGLLFDEIRAGNGPIWTAYAILATKGITPEAAQTLRAAVRGAAVVHLASAAGISADHVTRDALIYRESPRISIPDLLKPVGTIEQQVALQLDIAEDILELGASQDEVFGGENRAGILDPLPVIGSVTFWATRLAVAGYIVSMAATVGKEEEFVRQAVAVIDNKTTETCLNVHGQIVEEKENFKLSGTPQYASEMHDPPFHNGCRTSVAMIAKKYVDPDVTSGMRDEAIEQEKAPFVSSREGMAKYHVYGNKVREFREGRWHSFKQLKSNFDARKLAATLNNMTRS